MAEAVQELYPGTQITFGPIENGFYYDFYRDDAVHARGFRQIEQRMKEIVDRDEPITREIWTRDPAVAHFGEHGRRASRPNMWVTPRSRPTRRFRSIARAKWLDMCTGPHLPSTAKLGKAFKVMRISGAWRGDANNPQLQRASTAPAGPTRSSCKPI